MTRTERIEAALAALAEEAERVFLAVEDEGFPKGWKLPHLRNATAKARAALAPESGGPTELLSSTSPASEGDVDRGRPRTDAVNGSDAATGTPTRRGPPAPSSPSSAQGAGPVYCARCHLTEPLHHSPNIYTGRKDTRGHPYPPACEAFLGPTDPSLARGGA